MTHVGWSALLVMSVVALMSAAIGDAHGQGLPPSQVYLWNRGTQEIRFLLSEDQQNWTEFSIASDSNRTFRAPGDALYMKLVTEGQEVGYRLEKTKRYEIYWNEQSRRWEVAELQPR